MIGGPNSNGPWSGTPLGIGDGTGFWDGSNNSFASSVGSTTPGAATIAGFPVNACAWQNGAYFLVVLGGLALSQSTFASIHIGGGYNVTFNTASADVFDNTSQPGYTLWAWNNADEFSVSGSYPITIT
jgi:hypothetical protein